MTPDILFDIANPLALLGWVLLVAAPLAPRILTILSGLVIPGILSVLYVALILAHWWDAPGDFTSLQNVMALFEDPPMALAGWVHFLAFDLCVGTWGWLQARAAGVPHLLTIPALLLTFMFGPTGLLVFLILIGLAKLRATRTQEGAS